MSNTQPINFTRGIPANESFPLAEITEASQAILASNGPGIMQYGPALGFMPFREWLAAWQGVEASQMLTGNGSLELVEFLCRYMIQPGDAVFTESPSYDRALGLFRRHKAEIVGIPLEADGPNIESLESALKKRVPKFFYIIPDFKNPSGATCSDEKRRRVV